MAMGCLVLTMDGGVWLAFASALLGMTGGAGPTLMTTRPGSTASLPRLVRAMVSSIMVIATALSRDFRLDHRCRPWLRGYRHRLRILRGCRLAGAGHRVQTARSTVMASGD